MTTAAQNGSSRGESPLAREQLFSSSSSSSSSSKSSSDRPAAVIRRSPEDFVVEEIPAYAPSGRGEHLFILFEKRGLTTPDAIRMLARALDVDPRGAGFAGMKDRHAVTTQSASFPFPLARGDAEAALASISLPGITIVSAARHDHKLKPGHLVGNRFIITLRDLPEAASSSVMAALRELGRRGVPNAFGPQRFGRDGDNPERAIAWIAGRTRGPRDRRQQRLLFSALQSLLFNRVLEQRIEEGTWTSVLPGDLAKKHDTGGLFLVPEDGAELDDARARAEAGAVSATGPMFGAKMRWPSGEPAALERAVLATIFEDVRQLDTLRHLGEGTRRSLRLEVSDLEVCPLSPEAGMDMDRPSQARDQAHRDGGVGLVVRFVLPKGGYATTVLGQTVTLIDAAAHVAPTAPHPTDDADQTGGADPIRDDEDDLS